MAITFALVNAKGGVGKTSTCHHLAGTLARSGRRVLLIDNDPQASLTQGFWGPEAMRAIAGDASVAALFDPDLEPIPAALIRPTGLEGVRSCPGSEHLTRPTRLRPSRWARPRAASATSWPRSRDGFDLILIDCPPNLHLCSWAALVGGRCGRRPAPGRGLRVARGSPRSRRRSPPSRPGRTRRSACWAT